MLLSLSIIFASCKDDRFLYFEGNNSAPKIQLYTGTQSSRGNLQNMIKDSIKLSLKHSQYAYNFGLQLQDIELNITKLEYQQITGSGSIFLNGKVLPSSDITFDNQQILSLIDLRYIPSNIGTHRIGITATDKFDAVNTASIELIAFDNIYPIAKDTIYPRQIVDPLEYTIDATKSFDPDTKFGGGIYYYTFGVNGQSYQSNKPILNYIFPKAGTYTVTLQITDNDNAFSNILSKTITIK